MLTGVECPVDVYAFALCCCKLNAERVSSVTRRQRVVRITSGELLDVATNRFVRRAKAEHGLLDRCGVIFRMGEQTYRTPSRHPRSLPTYGPELNPIELLWGDIKRQLIKLAIDSPDELAKAIRRLRTQVPLDKIAS